MSKNKTPTEKKAITELSYTQKCIILANIFTDKKKILINLYDNLPLVKLYTAGLNEENFIYSRIRGALCFVLQEEDNKEKYFLQIYHIKNNSLAFSLPVNQLMTKDLIRIENNNTFFCLQTKFEFFGFEFKSKDAMDKFLSIFKFQDKKKIDENIKARDNKCTYKEILKTIKNVKTDFGKKFKAIDSINGKQEKEKDKNIFHKLHELYYLLKCIELDENNKKLNIFIDKTINPKTIQTYIDIYKNSDKKNELRFRIIFDDYTHIFNKNVYVDLLIRNLMNNFVEAKRLIIFRREHKKRHEKENNDESKRINSEFSVTSSGSSNNNDNFRNSAIIPKTNFHNNILQRKDNIGFDPKKRNSFLVGVNRIEEVPEEDIDHLKQFNDKKNKK